MITLRLLLSGALLLAISGGLQAQVHISGQVTDRVTGEPLPGVYVLWGKGEGSTTDAEGNYSISAGIGTLTLDFRLIGYGSCRKVLNVTGEGLMVFNVMLEPEALSLDQVVVSADRMEQKRSELTVSMDVIKSEQLFRTHITDAQELITRVPGIEVLDGQASVRGGSGFSYGAGSRVLALVDGLPMMSADAGNIKWQFMPLENLAQIEIIKGASSVLYGSSALNGVINFRTADASNIPATTFYTEGGIYDAPSRREWKWWGSPRLFGSASLSHLQKIRNSDIGVGVYITSDRGYRKYNDESLGRVSLRLKHHNGRVEGLKYGINLSGGKTFKTDFVLWENAVTGGLKQDTSTVSRLHGYILSADPFITLEKRGKAKHDFKMRILYSGNHFPERSFNNSDALSLYGEYQFRYIFSEIVSFTTGFSGMGSRINSLFYGDHHGLNLAGFIQGELRPVSRLKITTGIRVEQSSLDDISDRVVPVFRAGLNWQAAEYTFVRASFGQGYRYPSIAEKHASTTMGSVTIFPNTSVRAERGWSSELGVIQGFMTGSLTGEGDLSLFLSQNRDMIEYLFGLHSDSISDLSRLGFRAINVEQSRIYGAETMLKLSRRLGRVTATATSGYTWIHPAEVGSSTGNSVTWLKYRRMHSAKLGLSLTAGRFEVGTDLFVRSKTLNIDNVFLNETTGELILPGFIAYWEKHNRGYFLMDLSAGFRLSPSLRLSAAVKNLTNTEYMGRPGDIQPLRSFSLRLTISH